jgi:hypothetical protein
VNDSTLGCNSHATRLCRTAATGKLRRVVSAGSIMYSMDLVRLAMLAAVAFAVQLVPLDAFARNCPPIMFGDAHESLDELATRTLRGVLNEGGRYESGGFFIEKNGAFHASKPVTQRSGRSVNYCIVLPRGARLAGIYHTHVANSALSARDRSNAERVGVPSYIGTLRDRSLLVYDGRSREARALARGGAGAPARDAAVASRGVPVAEPESRSVRERLTALKQRVAELLDEAAQYF